ncbi:MAG TPA: DUF721 domain-containing protein [Thioploca sp.]|nr:MAG: hypothetical protein DRR19_17575 [Gammaproteobacteria bacterium]HDN25929.1 DUF721 domain-containing protein [Thioploca sp.]
MKSFSQLMATPSGVLSRLKQHSQTLKQLDKICKAHMPVPLNQHCHVANLREKTLVIHTDSSLIATRLRLQVPDLKQRWQGDSAMPTIDTVLVRVRPPENPIKPQCQNTAQVCSTQSTVDNGLENGGTKP